MKKCLLVRIPLFVADVDRDTQVQWSIFLNNGEPAGDVHVSPVYQLYSQWRENYCAETIVENDPVLPDPVVLLLPATWTINRDVVINSGQKKHIRTALPFLIEEDVAGDIESLHLCHTLSQKGNVASLTAIAHEKNQTSVNPV